MLLVNPLHASAPGPFDGDPWFADQWQTPVWGDADRLAKGTLLVAARTRGDGTNTRVFEVSHEGEVFGGVEWPQTAG